jgi:hypothetical protein
MDMAQNRSITDILKELKNDHKTVLLKAVEQATNSACEDAYKFSMSVLDRYYENYNPSRYDRTDNLWRAAMPIAKVEDMGDVIVGTFGVEYDPSVLDGVYDGSQKYEHPDGGWVLENYLMGIHPATNGGRTSDTAIYTPWQDAISPDEYLKKYLQIHKVKLANDVNDYLLKYVAR